ncbi:MAG: hypothetical protein PQJ60_09625 [Spirochaetales bacterium]|nr:hypothetical protein [Spirochaetales bacterium]
MNKWSVFSCLLLLTLLLSAACTTSSSRDRGSLSGAMEKASDDYDEERKVTDRTDPFDREESNTFSFRRSDREEPDNDSSTDRDLSLKASVPQPKKTDYPKGLLGFYTDWPLHYYVATEGSPLHLPIKIGLTDYPYDQLSCTFPYGEARFSTVFNRWSYRIVLRVKKNKLFPNTGLPAPNEKEESLESPDASDQPQEIEESQNPPKVNFPKQEHTYNPNPFIFMVRPAGGYGGTPYYDDQYGMELALGIDTDNLLDLYLFTGIHQLNTNVSHDLYESIGEKALLLNIGIDFRYYPFDEWSCVSPYAGVRIGGILMNWTYENPLTAGTDIIDYDSVGGISLGAFAGMDFIRTEHLSLGAQIMPVAYIFTSETSQGFDNDYFASQSMIRIGLEGGIRF